MTGRGPSSHLSFDELGIIGWEPRRGRKVKSRLSLFPKSGTGSEENRHSEDEKPALHSAEDRGETPRRDPEKKASVCREDSAKDAPSSPGFEIEELNKLGERERLAIGLLKHLDDHDNGTLRVFLREFGPDLRGGTLTAAEIHFALNEVDKAKLSDRLEESDVGYLIGILRDLLSGHGGAYYDPEDWMSDMVDGDMVDDLQPVAA